MGGKEEGRDNRQGRARRRLKEEGRERTKVYSHIPGGKEMGLGSRESSEI